MLAAALILSGFGGPARAASAIQFDLAMGDSSRDMTPGEEFTVTILNLLPAARYETSVKRKAIPILPFDDVKLAALPPPKADDACAPLQKALDAVKAATDEPAVGGPYAQLELAMAQIADPSACRAEKEAATLLLRTRARFALVAEPIVVRAGEEIEITISRPDGQKGDKTKTWTFVVSGGARGSWTTTYGLAFFPDQDESFYSEATATTGEYEVKKEADREDFDLTPVVVFSWVSRKSALRDWAHGLSGGIGFDKSSPLAFVGYGALFNRNIGIMLGAGAMKVTKLDGRFDEGQVIKENLGSDQLESTTYSPNLFLAFTYSFKGNPWKQDKDEKKDAK